MRDKELLQQLFCNCANDVTRVRNTLEVFLKIFSKLSSFNPFSLSFLPSFPSLCLDLHSWGLRNHQEHLIQRSREGLSWPIHCGVGGMTAELQTLSLSPNTYEMGYNTVNPPAQRRTGLSFHPAYTYYLDFKPQFPNVQNWVKDNIKQLTFRAHAFYMPGTMKNLFCALSHLIFITVP